jgi:hypothetical protein
MKIVVCNLGYDPQEIEIRALDGVEGTFPSLVKSIKSALGKGRTEIDGYKITNRNYVNTMEDTVNIIETEDPERCIYISQGISIKQKESGGKRKGAGRPTIGKEKRVKKYIFATPEEHEKLKKYLEELREEN